MPPSQTRSSSRRRSSAAKKIQKRFRSRKIKIQRQRSKASRKIQSRVRGKQTRKVINRGQNTMLSVNDCSICFEPLTEDVRIALPCGHRFHKDCKRQSLTSTQGRCPNCRTVVTNIPHPSIQQPPPSPPPPPPPPPLPPSLILDPIQRRQYTIERLQELEAIEQRITEQRQQLPDPPEIPALTFDEALNNEMRASETERAMRRHYAEAVTNYNYYTRSTINDEFLQQDVTNMFFITSEMLTRARNNTRNAVRIAAHIYNRRPA